MRLSLVLVFVVAACVPPDGSQPQYGGGQYGQPQQQAPAQPAPAAALNCMQLFNCFAGCNADGGCIQACQTQADPTSLQVASAVMQCGTQRCNNDSTCMQAQCQNEVNACSTNQAAVAQAPVAAPAPEAAPAAPAPAAAAANQMHISDLVKAFETNEVAAQGWVGQRVRIYGTANVIEFAKDGRVMLTYKSSVSTYSQGRCYFRADQNQRAGMLRANEQATVEGTVRGWEDGLLGAKTTIVLDDCVVP